MRWQRAQRAALVLALYCCTVVAVVGSAVSEIQPVRLIGTGIGDGSAQSTGRAAAARRLGATAFKLNDAVKVNWHGGGVYYDGKISAVGPGATYAILYSDGDSEKNVPGARIKPATPVVAAVVEQLRRGRHGRAQRRAAAAVCRPRLRGL